MKKRTKEESTVYARTLRARKKAAKIAVVAPVAPIVAPPASCLSCEQLRAEVSRLASALATMVDQQQADRPGVQPTSMMPLSGNPAVKMTDADAFRQPVIAAKVDRINNYGKNPSIGRASF